MLILINFEAHLSADNNFHSIGFTNMCNSILHVLCVFNRSVH